VKKTAIVYRLIPAKPKRELFSEIIRILAKQLDAARFEPHLTVLAAPQDREPPGKILRQINMSPIRLKVRDISYSSKFAKTLFVRFKPNSALDKLLVDLARVTKSRAKAARDPHVSLLYKKIPTATKKDLVSTIKLPFREVVFDSIQAVRCALPTRTRREVEAWRVVSTKRLSG
jgi:2'-5' RNA ligase